MQDTTVPDSQPVPASPGAGPPSTAPSDQKKTIVLLVIAIFLLIIAVTILFLQLKSHTPAIPDTIQTDLHAQTPAAATSADTYKIVYELNGGLFSMLGGGIKIHVGEFRRGADTKVVTEMLLGGEKMSTTQYTVNGLQVTCEDSYLGAGNTCEITEETSLSLEGTGVPTINGFVAVPENASSLGIATIAGRECEQVSFTFTNSSLSNNANWGYYFLLAAMLNSDEEQKTHRMAVDACIDRKTKLFLALNISTLQYSELTGQEVKVPVLEYLAVSYSEDVSKEELIPPVQVISEVAGCTADSVLVLVTALTTGEYPTNVSFFTQDWDKEKTVLRTDDLGMQQLEGGKTKALTFQPSQEKGSVYFDLCVGSDCSALMCYASSNDECFLASNDKAACEAKEDCVYSDPKCEQFSCYSLSTNSTCSAHATCRWNSLGTFGSCTDRSCYDYETQHACVTAPKKMKCEWGGYGSCSPAIEKNELYYSSLPDTNEDAPKQLSHFVFTAEVTSVSQATGTVDYHVGDVLTGEFAFDRSQPLSTTSESVWSVDRSYVYQGSGATNITVKSDADTWGPSAQESKVNVRIVDADRTDPSAPSDLFSYAQTGGGQQIYLDFIGNRGKPLDGVELPTTLSLADWENADVGGSIRISIWHNADGLSYILDADISELQQISK